jgi:hypothetical protein
MQMYTTDNFISTDILTFDKEEYFLSINSVNLNNIVNVTYYATPFA